VAKVADHIHKQHEVATATDTLVNYVKKRVRQV
jgi:predicted small metal-binding protein